MVQRLGGHVVKTASNLQSAIGLNVSESEFYALVHGAAHSLGLQSFLKDLGLEFGIDLESDSSSAKSFASRRGLGKQRHVQTRYLWLQDRVAKGDMRVNKIEGTRNVSDVLTEVTNGVVLAKHMATMGYVDIATSRLQKTTV